MTDNNNIQKTTSTLTLSQRMAARKLNNNTVLLLDVSGSMYSDIEPGKSKISALRDIVSNIPGSPVIFAFNDSTQGCTKNTVLNPCGGTKMSQALEHLKLRGHNKIIMITDGEAQDKEQTLISAAGMSIQILYIGAGQKPDFLDKLCAAAANGSFATKEDLKQTKELSAKLQLLLDSGEKTKDQTICL